MAPKNRVFPAPAEFFDSRRILVQSPALEGSFDEEVNFRHHVAALAAFNHRSGKGGDSFVVKGGHDDAGDSHSRWRDGGGRRFFFGNGRGLDAAVWAGEQKGARRRQQTEIKGTFP